MQCMQAGSLMRITRVWQRQRMIEGISRTEHLLQYPAIEDQGAQARDTEVGPKRLPSLQRVRHGTLHFLLNHELELQQHCIALDHHFTVHGKGPPLLHHAAGAATGSFRGKFAGRQQGQRRTRFAASLRGGIL